MLLVSTHLLAVGYYVVHTESVWENEKKMLWEHEPQASVSTVFFSSPKLSRVFL